MRSPPRVFPAAAANMDAELMLNWVKTALQCTDDACSYSRGMPVHSHDSAEGLKPEWVRQPAQHLLAPVMMDNSFRDHSPKPRHPRGKPVGHMAAMEWEICA